MAAAAPGPIYWGLVAFVLQAWMSALTLALGFPVRIGPPLLWLLDGAVIVTAWGPHVYFAITRPHSRQVGRLEESGGRAHRERTQQADISAVDLTVYPLVICAFISLLLASTWPDSLPPLGYLPVSAIPALLLAAWVVRYTRPR